MTERILMQKLKRFIATCQSQRHAAYKIGISASYLNRVMLGTRSVSNPKILHHFGLTKVGFMREGEIIKRPLTK